MTDPCTPDPIGPLTRKGDRPRVMRCVVGAVLVLIAVGFKATKGLDDWVFASLLITGAGAFDVSIVRDFIRAKSNGAA